jgi:rhamnogalacturonan endolyase
MAAAPRRCLQVAVGASLLVLLLAADPPPPPQAAGGGVTLHADDPTQVGVTTHCVILACWC